MSTLSAFPFIGEQSFGTPGAFNSPLSIISANIAAINADVGAVSGVTITPPSGNTITIASNLSVTGQLQAGPIYATGPVRVDVPSGQTNYLYLSDISNLRSDYIIGSQVGGTADGLNIWDDSGQTMIVSFSKQSVRFFQQVVGPVFDVGGALADTLNAATFGSGADSKESRIQAAISAASTGNISRVYVPASMYPYSAASVSFATGVQMVREGGNWAVYDVRAYGASGNGITDDFAACQGAITAIQGSDSSGGEVYFPPGAYRISSGLTSNTPGISLKGVGHAGDELFGPAVSRIVMDNDVVGFTFNGAASSTNFRGPVIRDLAFIASSSSASGGVRIRRTNNFVLDNVKVSGVTRLTGYGIFLDGTGNFCQYGTVYRSSAYSCASGFAMYLTSGVRIHGCHIDGNANAGAFKPGTSCISSQLGTANIISDTVLQGADSLVTLSVDENPLIIGNRYEIFGTAISLQSVVGACILGGSINNSLVGSTGTGIRFDSQCSRILTMVPNIFALNSSFSGSRNSSFGYMNEVLHLPLTGEIWWGDQSILLRRLSAGNLLVNNNLYTNAFLVVDNSSSGAGILFGGAQDTNLYRGAANLLKTDGSFSVPDGSAIAPVLRFSSESSLGLYRSGTSQLALSYGSLSIPKAAVAANTLLVGAAGGNINYAMLDGLRVGGNDVSNTIWNSTRDIYITRDSGGTIFLGRTSSTLTGIAINTTTGSLSLGAIGAGLGIKAGTNASCGTAVLGSNGSVNVATTYVAAGDLIFLTDQTAGGTLGDIEVGGIRAGSGFTILSTSITDTSTVAWLIVRPT